MLFVWSFFINYYAASCVGFSLQHTQSQKTTKLAEHSPRQLLATSLLLTHRVCSPSLPTTPLPTWLADQIYHLWRGLYFALDGHSALCRAPRRWLRDKTRTFLNWNTSKHFTSFFFFLIRAETWTGLKRKNDFFKAYNFEEFIVFRRELRARIKTYQLLLELRVWSLWCFQCNPI